MKTSRLIFLIPMLSLVLTACASPTATPPLPAPLPPTSTPTIVPPVALTGDWMGGATKPDGTTASIQIRFSDSESILNIEPLTRTWKLTLEQNGGTIHFTATGGTDEPFRKIEFKGTFANNVFSGELNWDGTTSIISFTPIVSVDKTILAKYEGVYRFESGRALSIIVSPIYSSADLYFVSQTLLMTDFESGALRGLYPIDDSSFMIGALRAVGEPFDGRLQFVKDEQGNVTGLMWWKTSNDLLSSPIPGEFASRVAYTSEDMPFVSADGTKLMGRLSLAESNAPIPAFMMLHGSEPGTRDNFGAKLMTHYMISHGFAILTYDKRGVGDSEGVYPEAANESNFHKHADDAAAGVEYLATRPEIDAKRIGLIGSSQAGWVIPIAALQSKQVSYFVILSGPVASVGHENVFSNYTNDGDASATKYDDAKITQQLRGMSPRGFDPIPVIVKLSQPGLWLWGGVDKSQPVTYGAENLQSIIDSGKTNLSYQVFPNGDHGLTASPHGLLVEVPYSPGIVFYPALTEWLKMNMSASTAAPNIDSVQVSEKDGMNLLYIPAGEFVMGSESGDDNEKPIHRVFLDPFWIDQTEITNGMYALCVNDGKCVVPGSKESLTRPTYYGEAKYNNFPVIFVDWNRAKTYCEWAGRRLPTEAEWEKAARGIDAFVYPWGNTMPNNDLLNHKDIIGDTTEVGIYPKGASPYGALDMAGNVWEWVNDWFAPDYYKNSPESNPPGPSTGRTRVLRGGAWNLNDDLVRPTFRGTHPSEPNLSIGFRCAMDANR